MENKSLPLFPGSEPCVNSGYCCKQAACPFGIWNQDKHQCEFLTEENLCGKYEEIINLPKEQWEFSPAFGAGCSSPLFNTERQRILNENPSIRFTWNEQNARKS